MRKLRVEVDDTDDPNGDTITAILVEDIPAVLSIMAPPYSVEDGFQQVANEYLRDRWWVNDIVLELLVLQAFFGLPRMPEIGENAADIVAPLVTWERNDDPGTVAGPAVAELPSTATSSAAPTWRGRSRSPRSSSVRLWSRSSMPPPPPPDPRRRRGK